ncbi:hypothetical protein ABW19_dt0200394 [Dactylella cylindrospora]|nr:hypothetical protein ABW19_dt0200394 [Dactylella cylindrospora]
MQANPNISVRAMSKSIWNFSFIVAFLVTSFPFPPTTLALLHPAATIHHLANPAISLDATITPPPQPNLVNERLHPRQATSSPGGREACPALSSVYSWCSSSGFPNLSGPSALASCACYYDKTWVPNIFDNIATTCYNYVRSIQPEAASAIAPYLNVCFTAGDISSAFTRGSLACNSVASILTSCAARTNLETTIAYTGSSSLAECACYGSSSSSLAYAPDRFDNLVFTCYTYAQGLQGQGGDISSLVGFCGTMGDVRLTASNALQNCQLFENQYNACDNLYTGVFSTLTGSQQASCLCYGAGMGWVPSVIDGAVSTCVSYLGTANPKRVTTFARYLDFCGELGDVRGGSNATSSEV